MGSNNIFDSTTCNDQISKTYQKLQKKKKQYDIQKKKKIIYIYIKIKTQKPA